MRRKPITGVVAGFFTLPVLAGQVYLWQGPSETERSGNWETAENWLVDGVTATSYPGATSNDDQAHFTNGTYTVTMASSKTLAVVERSKRNEDLASADHGTCTLDLNGCELTVSRRIDCSIRTYQFQGGRPGDGSVIVFTNGTVLCDAEVVTAQGGSEAAFAEAAGVGVGLPWSWPDRVRGVLSFSDAEAVFRSVTVASSQGAIRVENGSDMTVSGRFEIRGAAGTANGVALAVGGSGTRFTAGHIYMAGQNCSTNLFENGAVANVGWICQAVDQKENQTAEDVGAWTIVRSGATLNLTSANEGRSLYCHNKTVRPQHFVVTGPGSRVNLTCEGTKKGEPALDVGRIEFSPRSHTFEVHDGAAVAGGADSAMFVGADTGDNLVVVDDASLSIGYLMCGTTYWHQEADGKKLGLASNNTVRVSGRRAKLEVKGAEAFSNSASGGGGAMNLNYNTSLEISVPETGFDATPVQVPNDKLCTKGSTISGYAGNPGCRLTISAKKWAKKHKGEEQALISTAKDSSAAFVELTNNVVFADIAGGEPRPTFRIGKDGTATTLFLVAPRRGIEIIVR